MGYVLLVCIGAVGLALVIVLSRAAAKDRAEYARAPEILDGLFDGQQRVVYQTGKVAIPPTEVVEGAQERGYELESDTSDLNGRVMVFTKR